MTRRGLTLGIAAIAAVGLASCATHNPQGGTFPGDNSSITYFSTESSPKTITLRDLRTDEVLFTMDIPVGKQLTLKFEEGEGDDPVNTPDLMNYEVWDIGTTSGALLNSLTVPNASSRRLEVQIRQGTEWADQPAMRELRTDELADRPDWWTPEGGPMPDRDAAVTNYDG
ncbi:MAG: hypothetical protein ACYTG1_12220 [Planctomycetota bacterium]|jgi:hypothetical protein